MKYSPSIDKLIKEFSKLPGIGTKSATALAFSILKYSESDAHNFSNAILSVKKNVRLCKECYNICESEICEICLSVKREQDVICIVEKPTDLFSIEASNSYKGLYHVLHGRLSPIEGVGPEDIRIKELELRLQRRKFREIILATNPDVEGEATAIYISRQFEKYVERISKLAMGIPLGSHLEYADALTLSVSLSNRETISKKRSVL